MRKFIITKKRLLFIVGLLLVIGLTVGVTLWVTNKQSDKESVQTVKASVSKLMILPEDEEPTLAIVQEEDALQDKFLKDNAEKGDQILIYTNLGQAIIYRPSINKIVAVSRVTVDAAQAQAYGATIEIRNGTSDASIDDELKDVLAQKYPTAKFTITMANNKNFEKTTVIDNNDTKDNLFVQIIDELRAGRGVIPLGEAKATTDIVIIIGKDYLESRRL